MTVDETSTGTYTVTVVGGGGARTSHTVRVPSELPALLGCGGVSGAELVRCSFQFLLEREPATSILRSFSLEQIGDYFPEYPETIRLLVSPGDG